MESTITIKATQKEMNVFFDQNDVCLVKWFEPNKTGGYKAIIRHAELSKPLRGVFTIPRIIDKLSKNDG